MNSVSKLKIAIGYTLMLGVLFFSLLFIRREMERLMQTEDHNVQWVDSLFTLLEKKDQNTRAMLRMLTEASDTLISTSLIEQAIAPQDTFVVRERVQRRTITHRDTVVTRPKKKGFFRRLGEVFAPPKHDTAIQVKTSFEYTTDTLLEHYNPIDSLQARLKAAAEQQREVGMQLQQRRQNLQRMNRILSADIDTMLKHYEEATLLQAKTDAANRKEVRMRSAKTIAGVAVGGVVLAAFFLILIGRDIARSNRYRRELEEARRRAEDLLATREKLMLAITHDFKAPLGSIMGYADLLSGVTIDGQQRTYLDNMKASSEHLLKLVVDLLDFHRLDLHKVEVNRVAFYPARLIEEIRVSFEPLAAAKGLSLHCSVSPELQKAYICDPLRLKQIVNNLLSNAVKFTDRGSVTITAAYKERKLVLSVADTGKGMKPADRERIFQEFTRLPGAQGKEGFGLGLSIVRMLVQLLEGSIDVDSVPDKGSTFTLRIPIYPVAMSEGQRIKDGVADSISQPAPSNRKDSLSPTGKGHPDLRVLLIDDDRIQLTLTSAMLKQGGIDSVSCLQVDEVLDALRSGGHFDALLTDVQMPAISGFELLELLRASNIPCARNLPVIAVTARSDMQREDFTEHGFAGCLHKPFTVQELISELQGCPAPQPSATPGTGKNSSPDFAALTAFSGDDLEAASDIFQSFVKETRLNAERLRDALQAADAEAMSAVAHKMIPLLVLVGASELVASLRVLEASRGKAVDDALRAEAETALSRIASLLKEAEAYRPS